MSTILQRIKARKLQLKKFLSKTKKCQLGFHDYKVDIRYHFTSNTYSMLKIKTCSCCHKETIKIKSQEFYGLIV